MTTLTRIRQKQPIRDRWGRPFVAGAYRERVSTRSKRLETVGGLLDWSRNRIAAAYYADPGLALLPPDQALAEIDRLDDPAWQGTLIHGCVEALVYGGLMPAGAEPTHVEDAEAILAKIDELGMTVLASELLVYDAETKCAGTMDLLLAEGDTAYVGDIKTSARDDAYRWGALGWSIQTSIYAHGKPIDEHGDVVDWAVLGLPTPATDESLILQATRGKAKVLAVACDLDLGYAAARLAEKVHGMRTDVRYRRLI